MQQYIQESKGKSWDEIKKDIKEIIKRTKVDDERHHIAILFSSPLGIEKPNGMGGKQFVPVNEIPFTKVVDCFKRAVNDDLMLNMQIKQATPINFISTLSKNPIILHFIGLGTKWESMGKKECSILLENEDGSGQFVTAQKLSMIVSVCHSWLEIVMI